MGLTKYFVDTNGVYLGAFSGYQPPPVLIEPEEGEPYLENQDYVWPEFPTGAIEVPSVPDDARQIWTNGAWSAIPADQVTRISAAQFRQQLILDGVDGDVLPAINAIEDETKRKLILARYEFEPFFLIDDPDLLMLSGAIGYNTKQKRQQFFNKAGSIQGATSDA